MTKDEILALFGKQMKVRVTSNEKLEETLETAGDNDIVLTPEGNLYMHNLRLTLGDKGTIMFPFYAHQKEAFTQNDVVEHIVKKLPEYSNVCLGMTPIALWVQVQPNGTALFQYSGASGTVDFTGTPTLVSDTVKEV